MNRDHLNVSLYAHHEEVVDRWCREADLNRSQVLRALIEANASKRLIREGVALHFKQTRKD